jgi:hypothetical protein
MTTHDLTTHTTDITTLHPHPSNPRNGDTDAIAASLQANGQYRPIVATKDGTILAGNHTYAAAMELGWPTLDCVVLDIDPFSADAHRIMLADNRTADLGRYDDALLLDLLKELETLEGTGYTDDDLAALTHMVNAPDLDLLAAQVGAPTDEDHLVRVVLKLPADLAETFAAAVEVDGAEKVARRALA